MGHRALEGDTAVEHILRYCGESGVLGFDRMALLGDRRRNLTNEPQLVEFLFENSHRYIPTLFFRTTVNFYQMKLQE
jgi:hypothetical protein